MSKQLFALLDKANENIKAAGLFKPEFELRSPEAKRLEVNGRRYINLTSNDFLGLAQHEQIRKAAVQAMQKYGMGLASPRIISGTLDLHVELEKELATAFGKESAILFASGYDANLSVFESLFNDQDFLFCDIYSHPSLVDGIYKTQAQKLFFLRNDMSDLEDQLKRSPRARFRVIVVEGVYSMDGQIADLKSICALAAQYDAVVLVHDEYGIGVLGSRGLGSCEHSEVLDQVQVVTGTFSYALGGLEMGFVVGPKAVTDWLRQNSKPYVFSSAPAPMVVGAAREAFKMSLEMKVDRERLHFNTADLRKRLAMAGYTLLKSPHPVIGLVTYDAVKTQKLIDSLLEDGIFALGMCYPVVPKGFARVCIHLSLDHTERDIAIVANSFSNHGERLKIFKPNIKPAR